MVVESKEDLFNQIYDSSCEHNEILSFIKKFTPDKNMNLPNLGITLNNKLRDLEHIFQNAKLSLFRLQTEDYESSNSSFVGDTIILDLIDKYNKGTNLLGQYTATLDQIEAEEEKISNFEMANPLKMFSLTLKSLVNHSPSPLDTSYTRLEQLNNLRSYLLEEYRNIDEEIWNYDLRNDIISSLVNNFNKLDDTNDISNLLDSKIIPDFEKLGLADLISQLKEELKKSYEENQGIKSNPWKLTPEQKLQMAEEQNQSASNCNANLEKNSNCNQNSKESKLLEI